jgi:hypothetical protein
LCEHFPDAESTIKGSATLGIANSEATKPQPPETWTLRDAGGSELGTEIPQLSGGWAKCGALVGVSVPGSGRWWVGVIRRMHAELGRSMHADIAVFSREPLAVKLRIARSRSEEAAVWETASDSVSYHYVSAVLLPDISQATGKLNLLLPATGWKAGQVYEAMLGEAPRYLQVVQLLKRGEDYARVAFEWMPVPKR